MNLLRSVEDKEYLLFSQKHGAFAEMHRISQRQFPWQRGHFNLVDFYRFAYIYGQGKCSDHFENKNGISVNAFSLIGVALYMLCRDAPSVVRNFSMDIVDVGSREIECALQLLSTPCTFARREAPLLIQSSEKKYGRRFPIAYQPSILRKFPLLSFGNSNERLTAPLPELIAQRVTSGIYYDLLDGGDALRNEASKRFERYAQALMAANLQSVVCLDSYKYRVSKNQVETPDLLLSVAGSVQVIIECKSKKLTIGAKFSANPLEQAKNEYQEIIKGVFQLWRFFSHVRRGLARSEEINKDAIGMVLTLDSWLQMSSELVRSVLNEAKKLCVSDPFILEEDHRPVIFCSIEELERTLSH